MKANQDYSKNPESFLFQPRPQLLKMAKQRPAYIKCIQHTHVNMQTYSWCGERLSSFDWVFQDIDHATYSVIEGSYNIPCPDCVNAIFSILSDSAT